MSVDDKKLKNCGRIYRRKFGELILKKTLIIGVTGGSASGKTSVSHAILETFSNERIAMIEHDSYYKDQSHLTFEERTKTNYDHPLAFDTDYLIAQLKELQYGRAVDIPIYDYAKHTRSQETYRQEPVDVLIVEGILVLEDERLRDLMDIKYLLIQMTMCGLSVEFAEILKKEEELLIQ